MAPDVGDKQVHGAVTSGSELPGELEAPADPAVDRVHAEDLADA